MKKIKLTIKLTLLVALFSLMAEPLVQACSRVLWNNNGKVVVAARTMDWSHSFEDMVFVYPRGQKMDGGVDGGVEWTSITDCTDKVWYFDWSQNPNTIWVELKNLNFDEDQPVKVLNPRNPSLAGEVSRAFEAVK